VSDFPQRFCFFLFIIFFFLPAGVCFFFGRIFSKPTVSLPVIFFLMISDHWVFTNDLVHLFSASLLKGLPLVVEGILVGPGVSGQALILALFFPLGLRLFSPSKSVCFFFFFF